MLLPELDTAETEHKRKMENTRIERAAEAGLEYYASFLRNF